MVLVLCLSNSYAYHTETADGDICTAVRMLDLHTAAYGMIFALHAHF